MKAEIVKELPKKALRDRKDLQGFLKEKMLTNAKYQKLIFGEHEYKSLSSAQSSIAKAILCGDFPFKIKARNRELYLIRTDL